MTYEHTTVAVTGASGYLGAALSHTLATTQARLLMVSRSAPPPIAGADVLIADVRDRVCWETIVQRADVIFHAAGNTSVHAAAQDPAGSLSSTLLPLTHLAAAAREARRAPRVLYASTARVYGGVPTLPASEAAGTEPLAPFGLHSLLAEQLLTLASHQGVLDAIVLRLGNVFGPSPSGRAADERNAINKVTRLAMRGADLPLFGDGLHLRDFVYIDDVVRAFLTLGAIPSGGGRVFNVASGHGTTVRDAFHLIATRAERATGRQSRVREVPWPDEDARLDGDDFTADIASIASACGWMPAVTFADGIDRLIDHIVRTPLDG